MALSKETLALIIESQLGKHLDCFGAFDLTDPVCKKYCVLCLKCIIAKNKNFKVDILSDYLVSQPAPMGLN